MQTLGSSSTGVCMVICAKDNAKIIVSICTKNLFISKKTHLSVIFYFQVKSIFADQRSTAIIHSKWVWREKRKGKPQCRRRKHKLFRNASQNIHPHARVPRPPGQWIQADAQSEYWCRQSVLNNGISVRVSNKCLEKKMKKIEHTMNSNNKSQLHFSCVKYWHECVHSVRLCRLITSVCVKRSHDRCEMA